MKDVLAVMAPWIGIALGLTARGLRNWLLKRS